MNEQDSILNRLQRQFPRPGKVIWIGLRPGRRGLMEPVLEIDAQPDSGLAGDHYSGSSGRRQVTLIDAAHLSAAAGYLGRDHIDPSLLRRNFVVAGINLNSLKGQQFRVGDALMEYTDPCHPCSRMEENLGVGGYNAMRGHGGICARVLKGGLIRLGDLVIGEPVG